MFCKTGELKKIMKASLKRYGLFVCNVNNHYLVYADNWGIYVNHVFASNKFKAAIMELIGDIPEPGECYHYTIDEDKVIQRKSDYQFITARRDLTSNVISAKELETDSEHMPDRPSILDGKVLYFKNESTIYWVHTEPCGHKTKEVLFPLLDGINFFDSDWEREDLDASEDNKTDKVSDEQLNF